MTVTKRERKPSVITSTPEKKTQLTEPVQPVLLTLQLGSFSQRYFYSVKPYAIQDKVYCNHGTLVRAPQSLRSHHLTPRRNNEHFLYSYNEHNRLKIRITISMLISISVQKKRNALLTHRKFTNNSDVNRFNAGKGEESATESIIKSGNNVICGANDLMHQQNMCIM